MSAPAHTLNGGFIFARRNVAIAVATGASS
jgi:hypothetical protein